MWKKISCLLAIMIVLVAGSAEVSAAEQTEDDRIAMENVGSITIQLADTEDGTPKENVKFAIEKVADVINGEFVVVEEYEDLEIDFNAIETAEELSLVSEKLSEVVEDGIVVTTNEEGQVSLNNLELGVYLVYAQDSKKYGDIVPCMVSIPAWNETEGNMSYDITITPKYTPLLTAIQVNKVDSVTKEAILSKDFVFGLYSDEKCTQLITTVHAEQETGTATFRDLRYRTYYVKELEAPKGYKISDEIKKITINNDLEGVGDVHSFVYENTLLPSMFINTGDNTTVLFYISCVTISLLVIGFVVIGKEKRNANQRL